MFDAKKITGELIEWTREWFRSNGNGCNAIIGISGGKDSSVAAAVCVRALGKDRVIGVMMPNGTQADIDDSILLCNTLGIKNVTINIKDTYDTLIKEVGEKLGVCLTNQTKINLAPRIRMATLYAISQSMNGRVINTCNLSENMAGYSTIYGDHAGDVSLFDSLTVHEVIAIGEELGLPEKLVKKAPSDGLTDRVDEDNLGFTYAELDKLIRTGECENIKTREKIESRYFLGRFKLKLINFPHFDPGFENFLLNPRED